MRYESFCKCGNYILSDIPDSEHYDIDCIKCHKKHWGSKGYITPSRKKYWHRFLFRINMYIVRFRIKFNLIPKGMA